MTVFIDTSAFLAVLDGTDKHHLAAKEVWIKLVSSDAAIVSNNYVVLESFAVIQRRLGMEPLRVFSDDILPLINIEWIDGPVHKSGVSALLSAARKNLSLVDCVSFETMRSLGIRTAFVFDPHFKEQGFKCIP